MVFEIFLAAVIFALSRKGSFKRLQETRFKLPFLIIACFLIQGVAMAFYDKVEFFRNTFPIWIIMSYLVLAYCSWFNRSLPGFTLFGAGLLLNFTVIALNGGRMPVSVSALEWAGLSSYLQPLTEGITKHQLLTSTTNVPFLADIIPLSPPYAISSSVVSVGDLVMTCGVSWFFYRRMVG